MDTPSSDEGGQTREAKDDAAKKKKNPKTSPSQPKIKKRKPSKDKPSNGGGESSPSKKKVKKPSSSAKKQASTSKPAPVPPAGSAAAASSALNSSSNGRPTYVGVSYQSDYSQYEAKMFRMSREYNLGLFDLACDAALAYDAAYRITGSGTITNDVEEIKYALNWLDHPITDAVCGKKGGTFNFTAPSQYREARQCEINDYLSGKVDYPSFDLKSLPTEEELKVRIKKEILNLAKAYVAMQGVSQQDEQGLMNDDNDQGSDVASPSADDVDPMELKYKKKKRKTPLLKKKTWVPEDKSGPTDAQGVEDEEEAARREQAEALLFLQKKRHNETKKEALAQKLEKLMGGGSSSGASPALSNPPQNADESKRCATASSLNTATSAGDSAVASPSVAAASGARKSPEESAAANGNISSAAINEENELKQLQLKHQLLQQQQALMNLRAAAGAPNGLMQGGGDNGLSHLAQSGVPNNPALEQLLALAAQRPDMVNENVLRHAIQEQQAREAAALRTAQLRASLMANPGLDAAHLQGALQSHFPSQQAAAVAPGPFKNEEQPVNDPQQSKEKNEPEVANASKLKSDEQDDNSEESVNALLASMGHKGPVPPGLVESLKAALKESQGDSQHSVLREDDNARDLDPQELMRRQLANEARRAALAQKLSTLMAGGGDGQEPSGQSALVKIEPRQEPSNNEAKANAREEDMLEREKKQEAAQVAADLQSQLASKTAGHRSFEEEKSHQGNLPEHIASGAAAATAASHQEQQEQQRLQALRALQGLSGEPGSEGIDEQRLIQQLMLKKQMDEMNKQALEQKVQDYISGKGIPQPSQTHAGSNDEASRNLALQSLLQEGGTRQAMPADLVRQAAIQTLISQRDQRAFHGGNVSDAVTHDMVNRRILIESMLMSEENRLRQLREALQSQYVSQPQLSQMGSYGGGGSQINPHSHHALLLERERERAMMANQESSQEMAIRQALLLRASQGAASAESRAPGYNDISQEMLLEAARNHGVDPQTMLQLLRR